MRSLFLVALAILLAFSAANIVWAQSTPPSPRSDLVSPAGESPSVEESSNSDIGGGSTPEVTEGEKEKINNAKERKVQGGSYNQKSVENFKQKYKTTNIEKTSHSSSPTKPPFVKTTPTTGHKGVYQVFLGKDGQPGQYGITTKKTTQAIISQEAQKRANADKELSSRINKETNERKSEDEKLKKQSSSNTAGLVIVALTILCIFGLIAANRD